MVGRPAIFGKLPRHGDFVSRGLDDTLREAWDAWCSGQLVSLRAATGEDFEATHTAAGSWRFVVRDAEGWSAGAVAPSIDSGGRRFMLMTQFAALTLPEALALGPALASVGEESIYQALEHRLDVGAILEGLDAAGQAMSTEPALACAQLAPQVAGDGVWWRDGGLHAVGRWPPPGLLLVVSNPEVEPVQ